MKVYLNQWNFALIYWDVIRKMMINDIHIYWPHMLAYKFRCMFNNSVKIPLVVKPIAIVSFLTHTFVDDIMCGKFSICIQDPNVISCFTISPLGYIAKKIKESLQRQSFPFMLTGPVFACFLLYVIIVNQFAKLRFSLLNKEWDWPGIFCRN